MEIVCMSGAVVAICVSVVLSKKGNPAPWYLIVLGFTLFGMLIAGLFLARDIFPVSEPPSRLVLPPASAETIMGISGGSFYQADPLILAGDEKEYLYTYLGYDTWEWTTDYSWANHIMMDEDTCQPDVVELVEISSGKIKECKTVYPVSEWCPAPITSFAITQEGALWKYEKQLPCTFGIVIWLRIAGAAGFTLGVAIVLLTAIVRYLREN